MTELSPLPTCLSKARETPSSENALLLRTLHARIECDSGVRHDLRDVAKMFGVDLDEEEE